MQCVRHNPTMSDKGEQTEPNSAQATSDAIIPCVAPHTVKTSMGNQNTVLLEAHSCVLKVLGLVWRPETDDFVFNLKHLMDIFREKENTKSSVLRISAKIFDPMGCLTPFTIRLKCLFQDMWQRGISWDEELPEDMVASMVYGAASAVSDSHS